MLLLRSSKGVDDFSYKHIVPTELKRYGRFFQGLPSTNETLRPNLHAKLTPMDAFDGAPVKKK